MKWKLFNMDFLKGLFKMEIIQYGFSNDFYMEKNDSIKEEVHEHNSQNYGFVLNGILFYHPSSALLINLNRLKGESRGLSYIKLRKTMSVLFTYLLKNTGTRPISDNELLTEVWDKNGLKGSSHRLWEVMASLKGKLYDLGIKDNIILRVNSEGYMICSALVYPLYLKED
ncbi:TPA: winged helix-turn-helix domain-containing protein [Klebsiella quasipneumoniae subsp. similipneumoniae]